MTYLKINRYIVLCCEMFQNDLWPLSGEILKSRNGLKSSLMTLASFVFSILKITRGRKNFGEDGPWTFIYICVFTLVRQVI